MVKSQNRFKFFCLCKAMSKNQISAKRGTDSSFVVEANIKALNPKSSQS